jgi:hypothetical protein
LDVPPKLDFYAQSKKPEGAAKKEFRAAHLSVKLGHAIFGKAGF